MSGSVHPRANGPRGIQSSDGRSENEESSARRPTTTNLNTAPQSSKDTPTETTAKKTQAAATPSAASQNTIQVSSRVAPTDPTKTNSLGSSGPSANVTRRTYEIVTRYNETTKKLESFYVWVEYRRKDTNQFVDYGGFAVDDKGECPDAQAIVNLIDKAKLVHSELANCTGPITVTSGEKDTYTLKSGNKSLHVQPDNEIPNQSGAKETMEPVIKAYVKALSAVRISDTAGPNNKLPHDILGTNDKPETRTLDKNEGINDNDLNIYLRRIAANSKNNSVRPVPACPSDQLVTRMAAHVNSEKTLFIPVNTSGATIFLCKDKHTLYLYDPLSLTTIEDDQEDNYKWNNSIPIRSHWKNSICENHENDPFEETIHNFCLKHKIRRLRVDRTTAPAHSANVLGIAWFQHLSTLPELDEVSAFYKKVPTEIMIPRAKNGQLTRQEEAAAASPAPAGSPQRAPHALQPPPIVDYTSIFEDDKRIVQGQEIRLDWGQQLGWWLRLQTLLNGNKKEDLKRLNQALETNEKDLRKLNQNDLKLLVALEKMLPDSPDREAHISQDMLAFHARAIRRLAVNNQALYDMFIAREKEKAAPRSKAPGQAKAPDPS